MFSAKQICRSQSVCQSVVGYFQFGGEKDNDTYHLWDVCELLAWSRLQLSALAHTAFLLMTLYVFAKLSVW